jgi:hypothetical protein
MKKVGAGIQTPHMKYGGHKICCINVESPNKILKLKEIK